MLVLELEVRSLLADRDNLRGDRHQRPERRDARRVPDQSPAALMLLVWCSPAVGAASAMSLGSTWPWPARLGGQHPHHAAVAEGDEGIHQRVDEVAVVVAPPQQDDVDDVLVVLVDERAAGTARRRRPAGRRRSPRRSRAPGRPGRSGCPAVPPGGAAPPRDPRSRSPSPPTASPSGPRVGSVARSPQAPGPSRKRFVPTGGICARPGPAQPARNDRRTLRSGLSRVEVDQADRLPGAQRHRPVDDGHGGVRRAQCRQDVVPPVAGRAVPVPPPVVGRQQLPQGGEQVGVAARPGLQHRQPRGGVRHPDVQQPVGRPAPSTDVGQEALALAGEVADGLLGAGADLDHRLRRPVCMGATMAAGRRRGKGLPSRVGKAHPIESRRKPHEHGLWIRGQDGQERPALISDGLPSQLPDIDPDETAEWLESLDAVVEHAGRNRARYLMLSLLQRAREKQVGVPSLRSTDYINTIPPERSRGSPATSTSSAGSAPTSGGTPRSWSTARSGPASASAGTSPPTRPRRALRGRLQPLLPRQGPPRRRRPDLLPGPRLPRHLRPRVPRGPPDREPARRVPPGAVPPGRRAAVLPAPAADAGLLGVPHRLDGPGPAQRDLPGAVQPLPAQPRHQGHQPAARLGVPRRRRDGRARVARARSAWPRARSWTTSRSSSTATCSASTGRSAATARSSRSWSRSSAAPAGTSSRSSGAASGTRCSPRTPTARWST